MTDQIKHPYNDPENFEKIAEVYKGGYEWGIACVFKNKQSGRLYGDTMSGCSCYGPWEQGEYSYYCPEYNGVGDLIEITHQRQAGELLDDVHGEDETFGDGTGSPSTTERQDFVRAVAVALAA